MKWFGSSDLMMSKCWGGVLGYELWPPLCSSDPMKYSQYIRWNPCNSYEICWWFFLSRNVFWSTRFTHGLIRLNWIPSFCIFFPIRQPVADDHVGTSDACAEDFCHVIESWILPPATCQKKVLRRTVNNYVNWIYIYKLDRIWIVYPQTFTWTSSVLVNLV